MASSYTPNINLEKPGYGEKRNEWDQVVNANMDKIDAAFGEVGSNNLDGGNSASVYLPSQKIDGGSSSS